MIVRHFVNWVRTAPAGERAEATRALARAWLVSDLSDDDRAAAEGALLMLLDDVSPLVRRAMAEVFAAADAAPVAVVRALALDQDSVALPVLEYSPLLSDTDLVDLVATGSVAAQCAIARRLDLAAPVAAAIAEVGQPEATLALIENVLVEVPAFSLSRIIARHGHLAAIRETLLARDDLPTACRLALVTRLSQTLSSFVAERDWLGADRARGVAEEALARAVLNLAATSCEDDLDLLIDHLRQSGQLTAGLLLRALMSGNLDLVGEALAQLSGLPASRVAALIDAGGGAGLAALLSRAGLPASTTPAFRAALKEGREIGFAAPAGGLSRLNRRLVERVLAACERDAAADAGLLVLLRRFAMEAAREEARLFCDELVAMDETSVAIARRAA
ncbi:MAG: hypothetical protein DCC74_00770 [Proteobacteria bacterium]|nr:MAG: hypothetical protein DCC74_00770 [Pseudomonadota bacterium]